ncbi:Golgin subfamily A member 7/ERF4 family-domain-containing protein [Dichomitus squalens]|nr:Golgin subfamily A member 7/ERF4 family-domain-containing protein [Dichomitus squalens]
MNEPSALAPSTEPIPPAASAMSKLGLKTAPPEMDEPDTPLVIDISGPRRDTPDLDEGEEDEDEEEDEEDDEDEDEDEEDDGDDDMEAGMDTELTIRVDGEDVTPRDSDATDADMPHSGKHTDGGSTLYGSTAAAGSGMGIGSGGEHVHEHPLRLDIHPPSPPLGPWDSTRERDDDDEPGEFGLAERRARASPHRYAMSGTKANKVHEFGNKRSHNRPLIPHSSYYFGPPPPDSAYGSDPVGQIGVHHPREIVRVERDYTGGELPQFTPTYPLELEGRITPTQFLETINAINELLLSAHSLSHAFVDNALAYFTLQVSRAVKKTHYEKEMDRLKALIDELNVQMYNPVGLHIKWPRSVAFLFLEIEYY